MAYFLFVLFEFQGEYLCRTEGTNPWNSATILGYLNSMMLSTSETRKLSGPPGGFAGYFQFFFHARICRIFSHDYVNPNAHTCWFSIYWRTLVCRSFWHQRMGPWFFPVHKNPGPFSWSFMMQLYSNFLKPGFEAILHPFTTRISR